MGNLTTALVFVLALNVIMFLAQATMLDVNPNANDFWTDSDQMLETFDANDGTGEPVLDTENTYDNLPTATGQVSPATGNWYTDIFTSIKSWIGRTTGTSYLLQIVSAPYNLLKAMQLPNAFSFAIGTLWYGVTLFLIVAFILGRDS